MTATRKHYSSKFKARVAVEAIRGEKTLSQLGSQFQVHPVQIAQWRKAALKQLEACSDEDRRSWIEPEHPAISVRRQCALLGVSRASLYYEPVEESQENLRLMQRIDRQYTQAPFYGSRKMTAWLRAQGYQVNRKRVARLMRIMGIEAVYAKPKLSQPGEGHKIYPYLLKGLKIERCNQVWCTDITYIPMAQGFVYLVAVMDWFSRFVLSWALSLTMEVEFCLEALGSALRQSRPEIFNSDQGSQFTSERFLGELEQRQIAVSMDGRGRCMDNIFIERLWRSLKYEEVYLKDYQLVPEAHRGIEKYFQFYNHERLHQSLNYQTPAAIYEA
jgi:putative transposase